MSLGFDRSEPRDVRSESWIAAVDRRHGVSFGASAVFVVIALVLGGCGAATPLASRADHGSVAHARVVRHGDRAGRAACPGVLGCPVASGDRSRYLNIVGPGAEPSLPYMLGNRFRLAAGSRPYRLVGYDARGACNSVLRSPSGGDVIYGVDRGGWPALDLLNLATGSVSLFRAHACDPAWGQGDQIAYVHYLAFNASTGDYAGQVRVQRGLSGTPLAWTDDGAWSNLVWARGDLLASDVSGPGGGGQGSLVILYGPARQRSVDGHPGELGPFSTLVALNPQGTEALLDTQRFGPGGSSTRSEDLATLLRIDDATVLSTTRISANGQGQLVALGPDGVWSGEEIITTEGIFDGGSTHPPAVLATLTVTGDLVRLRSAKPFIIRGHIPMAQSLTQASQARFLAPGRRHIAVWLNAIGELEYLACDTLTGRCRSSRNNGDPYATHWSNATFVSNPSRP